MKRLIGLMLLAVLPGCNKDKGVESRVDNSATRYAAGLVTSTEKAKISVEKANRAIAAANDAADQFARETQ